MEESDYIPADACKNTSKVCANVLKVPLLRNQKKKKKKSFWWILCQLYFISALFKTCNSVQKHIQLNRALNVINSSIFSCISLRFRNNCVYFVEYHPTIGRTCILFFFMSIPLLLTIKWLYEIIVESLIKMTTASAFSCKSKRRNFDRSNVYDRWEQVQPALAIYTVLFLNDSFIMQSLKWGGGKTFFFSLQIYSQKTCNVTCTEQKKSDREKCISTLLKLLQLPGDSKLWLLKVYQGVLSIITSSHIQLFF